MKSISMIISQSFLYYRFLEINMDCGVDGFDIILPHQAGAAITVLLSSSFFIH